MKKIVFLTGAGISAESGIPTFRDAVTGLWENHRVEDVATHRAIVEHPDMLPTQLDNFIQTDFRVGLTEDNVNKAIKILNRYDEH